MTTVCARCGRCGKVPKAPIIFDMRRYGAPPTCLPCFRKGLKRLGNLGQERAR